MDVLVADLYALARGLLALALGGLVGWERGSKGKGAGMRTMMLVSFASFLFVEVSLVPSAQGPGAPADPLRAVQAIATGLGFVGAGLVFRDTSQGRTRGLTTAATLLAVSPLGVAVAFGHYALAIGSTLLVVFTLDTVGRFEARLLRRSPNSPPEP